jgi:hypothetical protein
MFTGRQGTIHSERDRKLEEARQQRRVRPSQADRPDALATKPSVNHKEVQNTCILTVIGCGIHFAMGLGKNPQWGGSAMAAQFLPRNPKWKGNSPRRNL